MRDQLTKRNKVCRRTPSLRITKFVGCLEIFPRGSGDSGNTSEMQGNPLSKGIQCYFFFVPFFDGACVKAEPATDLTALGVLGLDKSLPAVDATFFDVFSFFAMVLSFPVMINWWFAYHSLNSSNVGHASSLEKWTVVLPWFALVVARVLRIFG